MIKIAPTFILLNEFVYPYSTHYLQKTKMFTRFSDLKYRVSEYKIRTNVLFFKKEGVFMPDIRSGTRDLIEKGLFLPMAAAILNRDLEALDSCPFKLKQPYKQLISCSLKLAQKDLSDVRKELRKRKIKIYEVERDEAFTLYICTINGYEEKHRYFNPRIREQVTALLEYYLSLATI